MSAHYRPYLDEEQDEDGEEMTRSPSLQFYDKVAHKVLGVRAMVLGAFSVGLLGVLLGVLIGYFAHTSHGECKSSLAVALDSVRDEHPVAAERIISDLDRENIQSLVRKYVKQGSTSTDLSDVVAREVATMWEEYGLEGVSHSSYTVLESRPDPSASSLRLIDDSGQATPEPPSWATPFAFSTNAIITAKRAVYAGSGTSRDWRELKIMTDIQDSIVFVEISFTSPASVVRLAEAEGAVGVVFFPGKSEASNDVDVDDSSFSLLSSGAGDPLTPDYPAKSTAYRLRRNESEMLPRIPVYCTSRPWALTVISALRSTRQISSAQTLPQLPDPPANSSAWSLRLEVHASTELTRLYDVTGWIKGNVEPDRYVVIGSSRGGRTWSGVAVQMELIRVFVGLVREGWRPRRSLLFACWGGEPQGQFGSTEWVEEHVVNLRARAAAYIDLGEIVSGNRTLHVSSSPLLHSAIFNVTKLVENPDPGEVKDGRVTVYDTWLANNYLNLNKSAVFPADWFHGDPRERQQFNELTQIRPKVSLPHAAASYRPFLGRVGVPVISVSYIGMKPTPPAWLQHKEMPLLDVQETVDSDWKYHLSVAQVVGELVRDVADSLLLPYHLLDYAELLRSQEERLRLVQSAVTHTTPREKTVDVEAVISAVRNFTVSAADFHVRVKDLDPTDPMGIRRINDQLMLVERAFVVSDHYTQHTQHRHVVLSEGAVKDEYGDNFPGVTDDLIELTQSWSTESADLLRRNIAILTDAINSAATSLQEICCHIVRTGAQVHNHT